MTRLRSRLEELEESLAELEASGVVDETDLETVRKNAPAKKAAAKKAASAKQAK
jgi:hypothetical protein